MRRRCSYTSQPAGGERDAQCERTCADFRRKCAWPGETKEVTFRITPEDLKFYNSKLEYDWGPGEFVIRIGGNSSQVKSATVRWTKRWSAKAY